MSFSATQAPGHKWAKGRPNRQKLNLEFSSTQAKVKLIILTHKAKVKLIILTHTAKS